MTAPDLFLTYMNSQTVQFCTNRADVYHLNSVHGVYFGDTLRHIGQDLLPLAALNSMTLLGAELVGRSYGGGLLKIEPKEADLLPVPSAALVGAAASDLRQARRAVIGRMRAGNLVGALQLVDGIVLREHAGLTAAAILALRTAHIQMRTRRHRQSTRGWHSNFDVLVSALTKSGPELHRPGCFRARSRCLSSRYLKPYAPPPRGFFYVTGRLRRPMHACLAGPTSNKLTCLSHSGPGGRSCSSPRRA